MKNRKIGATVGLAVLCLAALLALFIFPGKNTHPNPEYNGDRILGEDQFTLDFTAMNGEQTHTLLLKAGDILHCVWRIDQGDVDIMISIAETKIYQGNRIDQAAFDLTIPADGDCTVSVKGTRAAGRIDIRRAR